MAANLQEITSFSLVIPNLDLLTTDDDRRAFQTSVDAEVRPGPGISINAATGQPQQTRTLHLDRDRIILTLSAPRSGLTREFPSLSNLETDASRFAQVVDHALNSTHDPKDTPYDFGHNAEMVFDQDQNPTAFEFLGQRLLKSENAMASNRQFLGGACRIIILDELGQWTYNLEPRFNDPEAQRVFISVNLHVAQRPLPTQAEVRNAILQIVSSTRDLMNRIAG